MKRIRYRIPALAAVILCLLSGCGGRDEPRLGVDGYVYTAEVLEEGNIPNIDSRNFAAAGSWLYYMENPSTLKRISLEEAEGGTGLAGGETVLTVSDILEAVAEDGGAKEGYGSAAIRDYAVESDGSICCLLEVNSATGSIAGIQNSSRSPENGDKNSPRGLLYKQSPEGETAFWTELPELRAREFTPDWLAADGRGLVYVLTAETVLAVDEDGRITGSLPVEPAGDVNTGTGKKGRLLQAKEGEVYYISEPVGIGSPEVFRVSSGASPGMTRISLPSVWRQEGIYEGTDCLLRSSQDNLFRYSEAEGVQEEILHWMDSGLSGNDVRDVVQLDADHYLAAVYADSSSQNLLLTKTPADTFTDKEIIVIASLSPGNPLRRSIVEFNRTNDTYYVTLATYDAAHSDDEGAAMRLDSSLVSRNAPDILDLTGLDIYKYADKAMLEDLNSYMEGGNVINRENYLGNLLEGFTMGGRLVTIPRGFVFTAVFGIAPETRSIENWTIPELMRLTERNPNKSLFQYPRGDAWLWQEFCAPYYLEAFVDWEKGECRFDSEEFCALLDWANALKQSGGQAQDALLEVSNVNFFDNYMHYPLQYGDNVAMYGYPSADGNGVYTAYMLDALALLSSSGHKEGAWEFLRFFLAEDTDEYWFPTRLDLLEKEYQDAITPGMSPRSFIGGGKPLEYDAMKQEQADTVMRALESIDFTPRSSAENSIAEIIWEEAQYLFDGSKDAEAVAATIQNRVEVLLQE